MKEIQHAVPMFGNSHAARHLRLLLLTCAIPLTAAAQSLYTGLNRPDRFAWVGAFSSGTVPKADGSFGVDFRGLDTKGNPSLRLVWLGCGKDDFVLRQSRQLDELLQSKGVPHTYKETAGNHTFLVWRRYLAEFAPLLFRQD